MSTPCLYVLDANVFIEAARRYYAFDLAPGFWHAVADYAAKGRVRSIDRVEQELMRGNDELAEWAMGEFHNWFAPTDQGNVIDAYRKIMIWLQHQQQYSNSAIADFASGADGWLIAYAKVNRCIVVTHERYDSSVRRKVPIPNVCMAFSVSTIDTFAMLRALGVRLG